MYMTAAHDHEEWQERKTAGNTARKDKQKTWASKNCKSTGIDPAPKEKYGKLSFLKSFKTALPTQVMFSDSESNNLVKKVMNDAFDDASN